MKFLKGIKRTWIFIVYNKIKRIIRSKLNGVTYGNVLQLAGTTEYDRHPDLFAFCQKTIGKKEIKRILSFGCSTGEECFTLNKYFPNAYIVGCDVNKIFIKKAVENNINKNIRFIHYKFLHREVPFDLIMANSVLCKQPEDRYISNISDVFPFSDYNSIICELDAILCNHGIIAIRNSDYELKDTDIGFKYECIFKVQSEFPLFSNLGDRIIGNKTRCEVYRKMVNSKMVQTNMN